MIILHFIFSGRDISNRPKEPAIVEPIHPYQCCVFDGINVPPRSFSSYDFCLVQTVYGLSEGVVVGVPNAPNGGEDTGFRQALTVADREILIGFKGSSQHSLAGLSVGDR